MNVVCCQVSGDVRAAVEGRTCLRAVKPSAEDPQSLSTSQCLSL